MGPGTASWRRPPTIDTGSRPVPSGYVRRSGYARYERSSYRRFSAAMRPRSSVSFCSDPSLTVPEGLTRQDV